MRPFCGYNVGDYFAHWLAIGEATAADKLPRLFWVNWFRKGDDGGFLWPGFGDNSRVLKWVLERVEGAGEAVDIDGLDLDEETMAQILEVEAEGWRAEIPLMEEHYEFVGAHLPDELRDELTELQKRLARE